MRANRWILAAAVAATITTYASCIRAATYTWAAQDGNFSDPANWIGGLAPAAGGSPTDQLVFPGTPQPDSTYTVTLDGSGPQVLNLLSFGPTPPSGRSDMSINGSSTNGLLFSGATPGIYASYNYNGTNTIAAPVTATSDLTLSGDQGSNLMLSGPLSSTSTQGRLQVSGVAVTYQNNGAASGFVETVIGNGGAASYPSPSITWDYAPADSTPVTASFGTGPITLANGSFGVRVTSPIQAPAAAPNAVIASTLPTTLATLDVASLQALLEALQGITLGESGGAGGSTGPFTRAPSPLLLPPLFPSPSLPVFPPPPVYLPAEVDISNPIVVEGDGALGASMSAPQTGLSLAPNTPASSPVATVRYTGPIHLNGTLGLGGNPEFGDAATGTTLIVAGTITLDPSNHLQSQIWGPETVINGPQHIIISGNIIDDPHSPQGPEQPLLFMIADGDSRDFTLTGNNTYSGGTDLNAGDLFVAPGSSLGTGNVTIDQGATLHLGAASNIAAGRKVLVVNAYSTLAIGFDSDPTALLDPASAGVLAIDTTFTTPLDLSKLGNGQMALGTTANGIYAATSLAPAADHVYRFGSPFSSGSILTILHGVLTDDHGIPARAQMAYVTLAAANSYSGGSTITGKVYANAAGALGTGDVSIGPPTSGDAYDAQLIISSLNAFSPTARVDVYGTLALVGPNGALAPDSLPPIFHSSSVLVLGDNVTQNNDRYPDAFPLALNASSLQLKGINTTTETIGPLSFTGSSSVILQNPSSGSHTTTLITPAIVPAPHSVLFLVTVNASLDPNAASSANMLVTAGLPVTHGMLPPVFQTRPQYFENWGSNYPADTFPPSSFLTYTPAGFAPAAYVPMPANGGTGSEIVDVTASNAQASGSLTLALDTSIYALRTAWPILNPSSGPVILHIGSGGLIASPNRNITPTTIEPALDFGSAEAILNIEGDMTTYNYAYVFSGPITATAGLTKVGLGALQLTNPANQISGPITVLEGSLQLASLPASSDPITLYDYTTLILPTANLTRPLQVMAGNSLYTGDATTLVGPSGQPLNISSPITGNGGLQLQSDTLVHIAVPIHLTGYIDLGDTPVLLSAPISATTIVLPMNTLSGAATLTAPAIYANEVTFSPGANPGDIATFILDTPTLTLTQSCVLNLDLDASGHCDQLIATGALIIDNLNGDWPDALNLNFLAPPDGHTYTLIAAASITGTFASVTGIPDGYILDYAQPGLVLLEPASAVPEPDALAMLLFLTAPTIHRSRRKM